MALTFDWSLNLSAVINAGVLIIGFVGTFHRLGSRMDLLTYRLKTLEETVRETRDIDTRLTTVEERVNNHGRDIRDVRDQVNGLKRGEGWITQHRKSIDGEYPEG
jgi:hypothetical protein